MSRRSELEDVRAAVIELSNARRADAGDDAALVPAILVVWETVEFDDEGPLHQVHYASAGDNSSLMVALGLASSATQLVMRDGGVGSCGC